MRFVLALLALTLLPSVALAQSFDVLDVPGDHTPMAVAEDGARAWFLAPDRRTLLRWTADGTTETFNTGLNPVVAVSSNGTAVGVTFVDGQSTATQWTPSGGVQVLEVGYADFTRATAVSSQGRVVAGSASRNVDGTFLPVPTGGFRLSEGSASRLGGVEQAVEPQGVSDDGRVVAGRWIEETSVFGDTNAAFWWTESGGFRDLGRFGSDSMVDFFPAPSGTLGAGTAFLPTSPTDFIYQPFRWTPKGGYQALDLVSTPFEDGIGAGVTSASADGRVLVGFWNRTRTSPDGSAALWTQGQARSLLDVLVVDYGLNVEASLRGRVGGEGSDGGHPKVSADGQVVIGVGQNFSGQAIIWRAVLAPPDDLIVNDAGDDEDADLSDGRCDTDAAATGDQCTLRAALQEANARDGADLVAFDLDPTDLVIAPGSPLPAITDPLTLDGATQPGTDAVPLVRLDGAEAGDDTDGLRIDADAVTVRGLIVTRFGRHGIHVVGGDGARLDQLIVGSDAAGTDGLGNGGDGIHVSGGTNIQIGSEGGGQARSARFLNIGVAVLGNFQNGIYVRDEGNAALIRAMRAGEPVAGRLRRIGVTIQNVTAGFIDALGEPVGRPNQQNGVCLVGVANATLRNLLIGDAGQNGVEIEASQNVRVSSMALGMRRRQLLRASHIGRIGGSGMRIRQSIGITVGSLNPDDDPVQGGATGGWFMDIDDSQEVSVYNLWAGLTPDVVALPNPLLQQLRNPFGGMRIGNSPRVTVGAPGVPTVFANNGGDAGQPQAGLFATGTGTTALRLLNLHLGTTPGGFAGIGNLGSGLHLADGVGGLFGGDTDAEQVVSGSNAHYGYLFEDLAPQPAGVDGADASVFISISATRLLSDLIQPENGSAIPLPNGRSGFCLNRVTGGLLRRIVAGPSGRHGIEVLNSSRIEIPSARVGSLFGPVMGVGDVFGPAEDGISIFGSSQVALGRLLDGPPGSVQQDVFVNGAAARGLAIEQSDGIFGSGLGIGASPPGSLESDAVFAALANDRGASLEQTDNILFDGVTFAGSQAAGLELSNLGTITITNSDFGELGPDGEPRRTNGPAAIAADAVGQLTLSLSRIFGHGAGILGTNSSIVLDGNRFEKQQPLDALLGDGVRQTGGLLEGLRNTFSDNSGAALRLGDLDTALFRFNNVEGNGLGVVAESNASRLAQDGIVATENWWGAASGPSGAGPGDGDAVSPGVDFAGWLTAPLGVVVVPERYVAEAGITSTVEIPVRFASPLVDDDVLTVTVTDERGWVTSPSSFTVDLTASAVAVEIVTATIAFDAASVVTVRAVSQGDASLVGEATLVLAPRGTALPLASDAEAGSSVLDADGEGTYVVGGEVILNPGGATEERGTIAGFGSIRLDAPLRFSHRAGELVVPASALAVASEGGPLTLPELFALAIYPNPASGVATVEVALPEAMEVRAEVFDLLGRRVATLHDGPLAAGTHPLALDAARLPAGVYLVRSVTPTVTLARRFTVVR